MTSAPISERAPLSSSGSGQLPKFGRPDVNLVTPLKPVVGRVRDSRLCTRGRRAAGIVRHVAIDVSGTALEGAFRAGQAFGVLPPGVDDRARAHKLRLYSVASPSTGEDGKGCIYATTVKRLIDEDPQTHRLFLGVASNHLCDLQVGDEVLVTGPSGKRFILPDNPTEHEYIFFATGTGIAPFRGMIMDLLAAGAQGRIVLVMGSPYTTDLLYDAELRQWAEQHGNFTYLTAVSRDPGPEGDGPIYVTDRLASHRDLLIPLLHEPRTLVYACGIAGMEVGIARALAEHLSPEALSSYVHVDPNAGKREEWTRKTIGRGIKPSERLLFEVY